MLQAAGIIGVLASRQVKGSQDFFLAGRSLPLYISTAALFATWFGSETVLRAPAKIAEEGLLGAIDDPFGAALCLMLLGLFYARPLYRMALLTFGDFYRVRYGRRTEVLASLLMIPSYFGWIAAQMVALGIILNVVLEIPTPAAILAASRVEVFYTFLGGMWAVSLTDFVQTLVIIAGLLFAFHELAPAQGISAFIAELPADTLRFTPEPRLRDILLYLTAWITIGLGSIPGQDVFQRLMSSRSARVAVWSALLA
ncbi:MAG: sodium:solute symporter family transporter [Pseudomonadota bacterium]|uniref:sodium:solute symporter family transporter n=1 Tax=Thermithiobacillus tepidarius TaxID=929 RepID=UPI0003FF4F6D|nr:hypothetical protein [Thermithiobacillus tepidarius]